MFQAIENWHRRRIFRRSTITPQQWANTWAVLPLLQGLSADEKQSLKELAMLFLHYKAFEGTHGLEVTDGMKLIIALQACLPILNLGWGLYDGWVSVIVYPAGFSPERVIRDEYGIEHEVRQNLAGQAWQRGPVLLSWDETRYSGAIDGRNLVIHEFAHKLDMHNGAANGFPYLHKGMSQETWTSTLSAGFEDFQHRCQHGLHIGIDCYGATSPAEFFAVFSEMFFERPDVIKAVYPEIYDQFRQYYQQDPLLRLPG
jgi:MtfA peptidase